MANSAIAVLNTRGNGIDVDWQLPIREILSIPDGSELYLHPPARHPEGHHLSLQKSQDGKLLAVAYTDDEHRITEVLWERPPSKELTDDDILEVIKNTPFVNGYLNQNLLTLCRAVLKRRDQ